MDNYLRSFLPILLAFIVVLQSPGSWGDIYSATVQLEDLAGIEAHVKDNLETYINMEQNRVDKIKYFFEYIKKASSSYREEGMKYLNNPVNGYLLIKRFANGWQDLRFLLSENVSKDLLTSLEENKEYFPSSKQDLSGSVSAIFRLMDTYNVTARELVEGDLPGFPKGLVSEERKERSGHTTQSSLTATECIGLSHTATSAARLLYAAQFMGEAMRLIQKDPTSYDGEVPLESVMEQYSWLLYLIRREVEALDLMQQVKKKYPQHPRAEGYITDFKHVLQNKTEIKRHKEWRFKAKEDIRLINNYQNTEYTKLCRGQLGKYSFKKALKLRCYLDSSNPGLILKPNKVEEVHKNPLIVIFREAVTDMQAFNFKYFSRYKLKRATVFDINDDKLGEAEFRVSKSAWISDDEDPSFRALSLRSHYTTNLSISTAEEWQIVNYGLGGQYEMHVDFGDKGTYLDERCPAGNRVATLLCYLSAPQSGGATVFTKLKIALQPSTGDCAFWWNLKRNGDGDYRTEHASCPVFIGSKWISNKWFHIRGQEFTRPCALDKNL